MIVLDTNVLSEVMKPAPSAEVAQWMLRERGSRLYTTAVCEAEIRLGIAILPDGRRKHDLETAATRVLALLDGRILPSTVRQQTSSPVSLRIGGGRGDRSRTSMPKSPRSLCHAA